MWFDRHYDKENHRKALDAHTKVVSLRVSYANSEYDEFSVNPLTVVPESFEPPYRILFLYNERGKSAVQTILL